MRVFIACDFKGQKKKTRHTRIICICYIIQMKHSKLYAYSTYDDECLFYEYININTSTAII